MTAFASLRSPLKQRRAACTAGDGPTGCSQAAGPATPPEPGRRRCLVSSTLRVVTLRMCYMQCAFSRSNSCRGAALTQRLTCVECVQVQMQQQAYQNLPQQQREEPAQHQVPRAMIAAQPCSPCRHVPKPCLCPPQLQPAPFGSAARAPVPNTGLSIPEDFRCRLRPCHRRLAVQRCTHPTYTCAATCVRSASASATSSMSETVVWPAT